MLRRKKQPQRDNHRPSNRRGHDHHDDFQTDNETIKRRLQTPDVKIYQALSGLKPGGIRLSFVLPVVNSDSGRKIAETYVAKLGFQNIQILHSESVADRATCFEVLASSSVALPTDFAVDDVQISEQSYRALNNSLRRRYERKLVIAGACLGQEAYPVALDTIFNVKGYLGETGFEGYEAFRAFNLRYQADGSALCRKLALLKVDVIYVVAVGPDVELQKRVFGEFVRAVRENPEIPSHAVLIFGGSSLSQEEARALGFDQAFPPGTTPLQIARFVSQTLANRTLDQNRE